MKHWYIRTSSRRLTCSLLNFNGKARLANFKCKDDNVNILFDKVFDFAKSKAGERITATRIGRNGKTMISIQFK